jgi:Flp pilus assembly protein TadG
MAVASDGTDFVEARSPRRRARRVLGMLVTRALRRFARREEASAAIEFGMVAAPFLAMLFAILETALVFFAGQTLETAVADASRLILTGQAQTAGYDQAAFLNQVCPKVSALFTCSKLIVDVQKVTPSGSNPNDFSNADIGMPKDGSGNIPVDAQGNLKFTASFNMGGAGDIVVVRLMYQWPIYVPVVGWITAFKSNMGSSQLLMATAAFRNEPYQ